ncbi:MAG TPA: MBL fold metallo-hydrolase [Kineosporiaceae bacterium]|nr:MBL fold metallo-hydrolase [Kineosporiaceae bacterium]
MTAGDGRWLGGEPHPLARCVLAPNPGPLTLDGTNTWVLSAPGSNSALVVDPGPDDEGHLHAVLAAVRERGARVVSVLLTHGHPDHGAGARRFAELSGAGVRALDPAQRLGGEGLADGDVVAAGELELRVVATPGHSGDSLCFLLPAAGALLTGDTVLGRGTTVVAPPDGRLVDYLASLHTLEGVCADAEPDWVFPGHGPVLPRPGEVVRHYLRHRRERLAQVSAAVADGARAAREVVERVYADVDRSLWPAAELSVRAQLDYLGEAGAQGPVDRTR